jgi:hypothetical protein
VLRTRKASLSEEFTSCSLVKSILYDYWPFFFAVLVFISISVSSALPCLEECAKMYAQHCACTDPSTLTSDLVSSCRALLIFLLPPRFRHSTHLDSNSYVFVRGTLACDSSHCAVSSTISRAHVAGLNRKASNHLSRRQRLDHPRHTPSPEIPPQYLPNMHAAPAFLLTHLTNPPLRTFPHNVLAPEAASQVYSSSHSANSCIRAPYPPF